MTERQAPRIAADSPLTVGVLGGMGPAATIDFMSRVLALTHADRDQDHLHLIVDQNPGVPNRQQAIRREGPDAGPALAAMARRLERAGADFLVMPCNSAHAFVADIRSAVTIPFVSIVDACVDDISRHVSPRGPVGVLATDGLLQAGIYQGSLRDAGFDVLLPSAREQERLMHLIHRIKAGERNRELAGEMEGLAERLVSQRAGCILAACTEIPLVLGADALTVAMVSSTEVLATRTVALARRELALPERGA